MTCWLATGIKYGDASWLNLCTAPLVRCGGQSAFAGLFSTSFLSLFTSAPSPFECNFLRCFSPSRLYILLIVPVFSIFPSSLWRSHQAQRQDNPTGLWCVSELLWSTTKMLRGFPGELLNWSSPAAHASHLTTCFFSLPHSQHVSSSSESSLILHVFHFLQVSVKKPLSVSWELSCWFVIRLLATGMNLADTSQFPCSSIQIERSGCEAADEALSQRAYSLFFPFPPLSSKVISHSVSVAFTSPHPLKSHVLTFSRCSSQQAVWRNVWKILPACGLPSSWNQVHSGSLRCSIHTK